MKINWKNGRNCLTKHHPILSLTLRARHDWSTGTRGTCRAWWTLGNRRVNYGHVLIHSFSTTQFTVMIHMKKKWCRIMMNQNTKKSVETNSCTQLSRKGYEFFNDGKVSYSLNNSLSFKKNLHQNKVK